MVIKEFSSNKFFHERIDNITECPHCKSKNYIKYGKYRDIQRYKCRNPLCGKTFSAETLCPWYYSKKSLEQWELYIKLMIEEDTLRMCAKKAKLNLATSFYWRHKVMDTFSEIINEGKLEEYVEVNRTIFNENFKGQRNIKRELNFIGEIKRERILVVSAIDLKRRAISIPVCKMPHKENIILSKIFNKVKDNAYIVTYNDQIIKRAADIHNNKIKIKKIDKKYIEQYFNQYLHKWFRKFNGVATKYLKNYLEWYLLVYRRKSKDSNKLIKDILYKNIYIQSKKIILKTVLG